MRVNIIGGINMLSLLSAVQTGGIIAIIVVVVVLLIASIAVLFFARYKKCPSDKVMVIYGKIAPKKKMVHKSHLSVFMVVQRLLCQ